MRALWTWRGHAYLALLARLYLGFVFIYACLHKIAEPATFALDVATYQFLPLPLINIFALVMPWLELLAGAMIVVGLRTGGGVRAIDLQALADRGPVPARGHGGIWSVRSARAVSSSPGTLVMISRSLLRSPS